MAVKIPAIPEIEDATEMINLVASSVKFKERMTAMVDVYAKVKEGLELYQQYKDIDSKFGEAQSLVDAAHQKMAMADKEVATSKEMADKTLSAMSEKKAAYELWQSGVRAGQDSRDKELDDREAKLAEREVAVGKATVTAKFMQEEASKLIKDNAELHDELEAKLGKLRQITV